MPLGHSIGASLASVMQLYELPSTAGGGSLVSNRLWLALLSPLPFMGPLLEGSHLGLHLFLEP
jgi:hypothetical protein